MSTLVIAEHNNEHLNPATLNAITAARQFNAPVTVLIVGESCEAAAKEAALVAGVNTVCLVDNPVYAHGLAENTSALILDMAANYSVILAASTTYSKNILPRVAAKLDVTQVSDVTHIIDKDTFEHPIYAGNAIETVRILDAIKVLTIRTTAFDAEKNQQTACNIERIDKVFTNSHTQFVSHSLSKSERPELAAAKIIVSGGRGLQNSEKFKLVETLADALGAAVGASRAAVDAGFVPNDCQVGQTGKVVAPDLYIALGISGAIQHLAGMKDSKVIVAINKDPDAPIFQIASYGLVGDLFELVPQLIAGLKQ